MSSAASSTDPIRDPSLASPSGRTHWLDLDAEIAQPDFGECVRAGLDQSEKSLPSQFFYDVEGSRLFEEICALPEYYLTRTEAEILESAAPDLAARFPEIETVIELGSGSAVKTETLLRAFESGGRRLRYVPIDVSRAALLDSVARLEQRHSRLEILAARAEYEPGCDRLSELDLGASLILWLGSSIGNLEPDAAGAFLARRRMALGEEDRMLVGIDLRKDRETLERAYDDAQGITARFDLNLLARINRELGGRFELDRFEHRVHYDEVSGSVQSFLVSLVDQTVPIRALDLEVAFRAGERIHTEDSYKYAPSEIDALAAAAGLAVEHRYLDREQRFSLNLLRAA